MKTSLKSLNVINTAVNEQSAIRQIDRRAKEKSIIPPITKTIDKDSGGNWKLYRVVQINSCPSYGMRGTENYCPAVYEENPHAWQQNKPNLSEYRSYGVGSTFKTESKRVSFWEWSIGYKLILYRMLETPTPYKGVNEKTKIYHDWTRKKLCQWVNLGDDEPWRRGAYVEVESKKVSLAEYLVGHPEEKETEYAQITPRDEELRLIKDGANKILSISHYMKSVN